MLAVRDLSVSFRTEQGIVRAVDGVSLDVAEGELLGVVGRIRLWKDCLAAGRHGPHH